MIEALITIYIVGAVISLYLASAAFTPGKPEAGQKLLAVTIFWPIVLLLFSIKGLIIIAKGK